MQLSGRSTKNGLSRIIKDRRQLLFAKLENLNITVYERDENKARYYDQIRKSRISTMMTTSDDDTFIHDSYGM
jgi:hypothetical protein